MKVTSARSKLDKCTPLHYTDNEGIPFSWLDDILFLTILISGDIFMAYQMTVTLTDQEYQILRAEAAKRGKLPEALLHEIIQHLQPTPQEKRPMTGREFMEQQYRDGEILNLPIPGPLTSEEQAERER